MLLSPNERNVRLYLLVDGGVAGAGGHPDLLVELVADRIRNVDGGVRVGAEDYPGGGRR